MKVGLTIGLRDLRERSRLPSRLVVFLDQQRTNPLKKVHAWGVSEGPPPTPGDLALLFLSYLSSFAARSCSPWPSTRQGPTSCQASTGGARPEVVRFEESRKSGQKKDWCECELGGRRKEGEPSLLWETYDPLFPEPFVTSRC